MLNIAFLSRVIPLDIKDEVLSKRKDTMSESGESLQWKIIQGLEENLNQPVKLFNYLPVQSFPKSYSEPYIKRRLFSHCENAQDICLPFLNIQYIKRLVMGKSLYREIRKWAKEKNDEDNKVIISYSLIPEFTKAITIAKKVNLKIKTCAIVADLPEYTVLTNKLSWNTRIYLNWMKKRTNSHLEAVDYFALLTDQMAEKLVTKQKYIVMEGIASKFSDSFSSISSVDNKKRILYAGTLNERFGIMRLIEAFSRLNGNQFELIICGIGDSLQRIKEIASKDPRIVYKGQLKREQVLEEMKKTCVIVNPRPDGEEFTKYSFPSKNLEALSSGIPFIAYKLAGIGDEYDRFINYPSDDSTDSLSRIIKEVAEDKDGIFRLKAVEAKNWVIQNKSAASQARRILDLLCS